MHCWHVGGLWRRQNQFYAACAMILKCVSIACGRSVEASKPIWCCLRDCLGRCFNDMWAVCGDVKINFMQPAQWFWKCFNCMWAVCGSFKINFIQPAQWFWKVFQWHVGGLWRLQNQCYAACATILTCVSIACGQSVEASKHILYSLRGGFAPRPTVRKKGMCHAIN